MKLYRVSIGQTELFAAGMDEDDIYSRRESLDPTFSYLPIVIDEVKIDGYEITVTANNGIPNDREGLKAWLTSRNVEFTPQWGEQKLRELALSVA